MDPRPTPLASALFSRRPAQGWERQRFDASIGTRYGDTRCEVDVAIDIEILCLEPETRHIEVCADVFGGSSYPVVEFDSFGVVELAVALTHADEPVAGFLKDLLVGFHCGSFQRL